MSPRQDEEFSNLGLGGGFINCNESNLKDVDLYLTENCADDNPTLEEKKGKYSLILEHFCSEHVL